VINPLLGNHDSNSRYTLRQVEQKAAGATTSEEPKFSLQPLLRSEVNQLKEMAAVHPFRFGRRQPFRFGHRLPSETSPA
jgi:hypothetical protein